MEFACKLSQTTGRKYRMMTEAEFEYAAKNHLSSLEKIGSGEEWAYNSWSTTNQGQMTVLANGKWFTVNNTFLRITHSTGYTTDYLYAVTSDGTFYHDSCQAYERADFRMFQRVVGR
jgi:formylglycine-generating enzyme required for sulfatase activity